MINRLASKIGIRVTPEKEEIIEIAKNCEGIFEDMEKGISDGNSVLKREGLNAIKDDFKRFSEDELKWVNHNLDEKNWDKKTAEERKNIFNKLKDFFDMLRSVNRKELRSGVAFIVVMTVLFIATMAVYIYLHGPGRSNSVMSQATVARTGAVSSAKDDQGQKKVRTVEQDLVDAHKHLASMEDNITQINKIPNDNKKDNIEKRKITNQKIENSFNAFKDIILQDTFRSQLPHDLIVKLGELGEEVEKGAVTSDSFDKKKKAVAAWLESVNSKYFWIDDPRKWLEIIFWSCMGTMVGLIFYVAKQLDAGIFHTNEIAMMITEIVITPLTVLTIFFLFAFTGITGFTPTESSIYATLGISFILGFAIRRTTGFLETIKKRLLPEPSREDKNT